MKPLEGTRILAVSQYGAGPYATLHLADLGAEVIKIEDPATGGDVSRGVIPYAENGDSVYFQAFNRNKKSITLNFRHPEAAAVFRGLAEKSDAVFNNLRGDVPDKLGLTYPHLKDINPAIVTCSLSGFGTSGSRRAEPAYDYLLQAMLGHMHLTGEPDGPPEKYGLSLIDFSTGIMAALGIMVGLYQAKTRGVGCDVDVSLFDTAASLLNYIAAWSLSRGHRPSKTKHSAHPSLVPSQMFQTRDSHVMVMCNKEKFFPLLCAGLGLPELAEDPRYADFSARLANRESLLPVLAGAFSRETTAHWIGCFRGRVPCAPVNSVEEALADPFLEEREMIAELEHPKLGPLRMMGLPVKVAGHRPEYRPGPALGEHNEEIYTQLLGKSPAEISALRSKGVI